MGISFQKFLIASKRHDIYLLSLIGAHCQIVILQFRVGLISI